MAVTEHPAGGILVPRAPERAARSDLRAQIARIERDLARLAASTYPRLECGPAMPPASAGPRVLGLGELEAVRDALAARLAVLREAAAAQAERQAEARAELAAMLADPPAHRGRRLTNTDLGFAGCTTYEVVPRLGLVGMLAGWWQVKISSGCPLEPVSEPAARPRPLSRGCRSGAADDRHRARVPF